MSMHYGFSIYHLGISYELFAFQEECLGVQD